MMKLIKDLGVIYRTKESPQGCRYGIYECAKCKGHTTIRTCTVKNRELCSSCSASKRQTKHGHFGTRLYGIYYGMLTRCYNKNLISYEGYGSRGITVCGEWRKDFLVFYEWAISNGYKDTLTIDRKDNDGNYEPSNCRWATYKIQARNRNKNKNNTTGFKGVYLNKPNGKYRARISFDKNTVNIGTYKCRYCAAIAYDTFVLRNNLEHKRNFA